jgi:hypothetical protein
LASWAAKIGTSSSTVIKPGVLDAISVWQSELPPTLRFMFGPGNDITPGEPVGEFLSAAWAIGWFLMQTVHDHGFQIRRNLHFGTLRRRNWLLLKMLGCQLQGSAGLEDK